MKKQKKKVTTAIFILVLSFMFAQERPNIIVVLADDIGVGDISHYRRMHSDTIVLETPALDQLAKEGMVFTNAHAPAALCAPSRYAIMTGNHCYRSEFPWGVWGAYQESPIKPGQLTLGKLMKQAGYRTAFLGKWHLGGDYLRKDDSTQIYRGPRNKPEVDVDIREIVGGGPQYQGFDYSLTFPAGIQASPYAVYENGDWMPLEPDSKIDFISQENMTKIGVKLDKLEGLGDSNWDPHDMGPLLVNKAVDFIGENSHTEAPFFMYYCSQAVHLPHTPPKTLNGTKIAGTTPSRHLEMVRELDVQMEMIVQKLKEEGVYDNTLIIFTSDNGGLLVSETLKSGHRPSDIYRGGKNQAYEGGYRVPFIATWPSKITAGSSNKAVLGLDVMATLASLTEQKIAKGQAMDSSDLLPILLGTKEMEPHSEIIAQGGTGREVMITSDGLKLIIQIDKKDKTDQKRVPIALFDLKQNPSENEEFNLIDDAKYKPQINTLFQTYNETRNGGIPTGVP